MEKLAMLDRQLSSQIISKHYSKQNVVTVNSWGKIIQSVPCQAKYFTEKLGNGVILEMVEIPRGTFLMGTGNESIKRMPQKSGVDYIRWEKPQREVTVKPFHMGKYPITQAQWRAVCEAVPSEAPPAGI